MNEGFASSSATRICGSEHQTKQFLKDKIRAPLEDLKKQALAKG